MRYAKTLSALTMGAAVMGGGTALAAGLANDSVASRHIKDGAVRSVDLDDDSVTGRDVDEDSLRTVPTAEMAGIADLAKSAEEATLAGHAETAGRLLGLQRASVTATGGLKPEQSFNAVTAEQTSTPGRYVVTFGGPLAGCFFMAGVGTNETERVVGSASAWLTPFADNPKLSKVTVETHAPGVADDVSDPLPFNLLVVC